MGIRRPGMTATSEAPRSSGNLGNTMRAMAEAMEALSERVRHLEALPTQRTWVELADRELTVPAISFDFTGISQAYRHLHIVGLARSAVAADTDALALRFNADAAADYDWVYAHVHLLGAVATWTAVEGVAATRLELGLMPGNTAPASIYGPIEINLPHYRSIIHRKAVRAQGGHIVALAAAGIHADMAHGVWRTAGTPINRITFLLASGSNFMAGSRITVYGMG